MTEWPKTRVEQEAADHGFTEAQYKAARRIEYIIFGPYEWQNEGDRASTMFVQIMQALKDQADAQNAITKSQNGLEPGEWFKDQPETTPSR